MPCDADWLFQRERHCIVGDGVDVADDFRRHASVIFEAGGSVGDVVLSFDDRLAGIAAFEFGESGKVGADFFGEAEEDAAAFLRGGAGPWAFFESRFRSGDGAVDVFGAGIGDLGDDFLGRGIVDGEGFRRMTRGPFVC